MNKIKNYLKNSSIKIKIIIIVLISISLLGSIYGYSLYKSVKNSQIVKNNEEKNNSGSLEKSSSGNTENNGEQGNIKNKINEPILMSAGEDDLNYKFNINGNIKIEKDGTINKSGEISIKDLDLVSMENGLKQRINIGNLSLESKDVINRENNINIEEVGLDIINNNEKIYIYLSGGIDKLILNENIKNLFDIEEAIKINKSGNYIMIDNSKVLLDSLGEIGNNELLKELILAFSTNNPKAYLEKNGTITKIKNELKNDKIINYIFEEIQDGGNNEKKYMKINEGVCDNISIIYQTILGNLYQDNKLKSNCKENIKQLNSYISMTGEIYKEGDIKKGDYKFYIRQGSLLNIVLEYKKNRLINFNIKYFNPYNGIDLTITGDDKKITSSKLDLEMNLNGLDITGYILNGEGEIKIAGNYGGIMNISGSLKFNDYKIKKYDLIGVGKDLFEGTNINANGEEYKGEINFITEIDHTIIRKYDLIYDNKEYRINIIDNNININGNYKKDKFSLKFYNTLTSEKESGFSLYYNNGKIYGSIKNINGTEYDVNGNYKSIAEFELNILDKNTKESVKLSSKIEDGKIKYLIQISEKYEKITGELEIEYLNGPGEYKIPGNYTEFNLENYQTIIIPNLNESEKMIKNNNIVGLLGNLLIPIYNKYNVFKINEYTILSEEKEENIDKLNEIIFKKEYAGEDPFTFVIGDKTYISYMDIDLEDLVFGEDYIIGTPNYEVLGIDKKDSLNPIDNDEYIIEITNIEDKFKFQILPKQNY